MSLTIAHLSSRALISVSGPDWKTFLQGLITQNVETLQEGDLRYGALLTPQGRLLNDLFVWESQDGGVLDVAADIREQLIAKLTLYRLRVKVQITALDQAVFAAWGGPPPPLERGWRSDPRLADLGFRGVGAALDDAQPEAVYDAHRLALGVPDPAKDATESDYPIEINFDLLNGIDFKKGCFVGQETTSRMHRRGMVKTRMAPVTFQGAALPFGGEILAGERRAGEIRGGVDGRAMALLRIDRAGEDVLTVEGRPVEVDLPPWLERLFQKTADELPQS